MRLARSLLVSVLIAAGIALAVEATAKGSFGAIRSFASGTPLVLASLLILGWLWAGDALMGRPHRGALVVAPCLIALAWLNAQKQQYLHEPLYPWDFLFVRQVLDLMPTLAADRPWAAGAAIGGTSVALAAVPLVWLRRSYRGGRLRARARTLRLAVALPLLAVGAYGFHPSGWWMYRDAFGLIPTNWDQTNHYKTLGFLLGFAYNGNSALVIKPAGYSQRALPSPTLASLEFPRENLPDIVIVMNEAYWDPTRLPRIAFAPDPMPTTRALASGTIFSPAFGGGTSNVEFEALTAFSNAVLPTGSIAYQQYIRQDTPSLARFLRWMGYRSLAMHPYHAWFWNRRAIYPMLGFDEFLAIDELASLAIRGRFTSDEALADEIARQVDASDRPAFVFAVTMENHGPYEPGRYPVPTITVEGDLPPDLLGSLQTFAEGVASGDRALRRLVDWAHARPRHTILVYFGDHLPYLGPDLATYSHSGFIDPPVKRRPLPLHDLFLMRQTPLVVWSNHAGPVRDLGAVSPSYLPLIVLEQAGIDHPFYTGFLGSLRARYRVIDRRVLLTDAGDPVEGWAPSNSTELNQYALLQYDLIFGGLHARTGYFPSFANAAGPSPGLAQGTLPRPNHERRESDERAPRRRRALRMPRAIHPAVARAGLRTGLEQPHGSGAKRPITRGTRDVSVRELPTRATSPPNRANLTPTERRRDWRLG
ncbi:MAG: hypothetical protein FJ255_12620 [Phycisphaerae bacterium]|nr:hypothetical protein [Phycisphaerae bacterium]